MEQDFKVFIASEKYSDFNLLYRMSRNNKIKYRFNKCYYIIEYFLENNINYSKKNFEELENIYKEFYKDICEIKYEPKIDIDVLSISSSTSLYSLEYKDDIRNLEDIDTMLDIENNVIIEKDTKNKYILSKSPSNIPKVPIFFKKSYFKEMYEDNNNYSEEYESCNEDINYVLNINSDDELSE